MNHHKILRDFLWCQRVTVTNEASFFFLTRWSSNPLSPHCRDSLTAWLVAMHLHWEYAMSGEKASQPFYFFLTQAVASVNAVIVLLMSSVELQPMLATVAIDNSPCVSWLSSLTVWFRVVTENIRLDSNVFVCQSTAQVHRKELNMDVRELYLDQNWAVIL